MSRRLWTLTDGDDQLCGGLRIDQVSGWQIWVSHNDVIRYRERHATRTQAEAEAEYCRQMFVEKGWTPVPEQQR